MDIGVFPLRTAVDSVDEASHFWRRHVCGAPPVSPVTVMKKENVRRTVYCEKVPRQLR